MLRRKSIIRHQCTHPGAACDIADETPVRCRASHHVSAAVEIVDHRRIVTSLRYVPLAIDAVNAFLMHCHAVGYGRQTLLRRVASRPAAGATILGNKLFCCALTVWVGVPAALTLVGTEATLIVVAVSLVALGGALIIHEPSYSRRTRRARVVVVFGSIAAMIVGILYASPGNASRFSVTVDPRSVGAVADSPP